MPATILLVEDHAETSKLIAGALATAGGFDVVAVPAVGEALERLAAGGIDCVLLDYRLPDTAGLDGLRAVRARHPDVPVVIVTGAGSEHVAVDAMKLGATDYVVKEGRYVRRVPLVVPEALGRRALQRLPSAKSSPRVGGRGAAALRERFRGDGVFAEGSGLDAVFELVARAARSSVTVLLAGESGTGKELFARAIHAHGPRAAKPFLAQNCAALAEQLLESELFGHVRGAFTGADRTRRGLFEEAAGGTLFLDEVSEISLSIQAKLLRALQEKEVRAVGSSTTHAVNVRVIAATNVDLRKAVEDGAFRLDLYHRLCVFPIMLPPLRERVEDIAPLAHYFLRHFGEQEQLEVPGFEPEALRCLERYAWPGNVRELQNEMLRLVLCGEPGQPISLEALSPWIREHGQAPSEDGRSLRDILRDVELATIWARLREHGYRRSATATSLGITREALWAKLRQLGVDVPSRRSSGDE
jgi:two-component system NtrC family response regulator